MRILFNFEELGILGRGGDGGGGDGGGDTAAPAATDYGVAQLSVADSNSQGCMAAANAPNFGQYAACNALQNGLCVVAGFAPVGSSTAQALAAQIGEACRQGVTNVMSTDPAIRENAEPGLQSNSDTTGGYAGGAIDDGARG